MLIGLVCTGQKAVPGLGTVLVCGSRAVLARNGAVKLGGTWLHVLDTAG